MQTFSADYLDETRAGMWEDSIAALDLLNLSHRDRILDVGCGVGHLTHILKKESTATLVGLDADISLLTHLEGIEKIAGDATQLPLTTNSFDLVIAQALLINLPRPREALIEFQRVSSDLVAVIEPDNSEVAVDST
ncbi:MAG: class I SAM-dependent methyltransferase, partial [Halobacteriaceae archaeon]